MAMVGARLILLCAIVGCARGDSADAAPAAEVVAETDAEKLQRLQLAEAMWSTRMWAAERARDSVVAAMIDSLIRVGKMEAWIARQDAAGRLLFLIEDTTLLRRGAPLRNAMQEVSTAEDSLTLVRRELNAFKAGR